MRVSLINVGCRLNYAEIDYLASYFKKAGAEIDFSDNGDTILINTCAVTKEAERKSFSLIRYYGQRKPVIVSGCLTAIAKEKIEKIPGVYQIVTLKEKERMMENLFPTPSRNRGVVKIVDGCPNRCTFCLLPEMRGKEIRSKAKEKIFSEISFLVANGFSEIVLTGLNLGLYGKELGSSLTSLLWLIFERCSGDFRLRLSSLEPDLIDRDLIKAIASLPICRHLHISVQSFSDEIILRMGRKYQREEIRDKMGMIISEIPEINLGCDIIVGFSGEREEDFLKTRDALSELPFAYFHIFPFSPRPMTLAFSLPDDVPSGEKKRRVSVLRALGRKKREEYQRRFLGKKLFAVREREGMVVTDNYLRVKVSNHPIPQGIFPVWIEEVNGDAVIGRITN